MTPSCTTRDRVAMLLTAIWIPHHPQQLDLRRYHRSCDAARPRLPHGEIASACTGRMWVHVTGIVSWQQVVMT